MFTNKFKVGSTVVVVDPKDNHKYFSKGASGVVVKVDSIGYLVKFTSGTHDPDCEGSWWVDEDSLEAVPVRRMEAHKTAYRAEQERAISGGLQSHSVGDIYPLAVVGYDNGGDGVTYTIENLQTGEVCMAGDWVRQWDNSRWPLEFAKVIGTKRDVSWKQGRPVFYKDGALVLEVPRPIKNFEVTLLAAIAEYQRALEQDIG